VIWVGASLRDLREFPAQVQDNVGYALYVAQHGGRHQDAKALRGFGGAGVLEVITDYRGDTFGGVHTEICRVVFVLHAFQKSRRAENKLRAGTSN